MTDNLTKNLIEHGVKELKSAVIHRQNMCYAENGHLYETESDPEQMFLESYKTHVGSNGRIYKRTGYIYCTCPDICDNALWISRDDGLMLFMRDADAAEQAEKDGFCKIIHDLPDWFNKAEDGGEPFVDTIENREHIKAYLKREYNYDWNYDLNTERRTSKISK